MTMIPPTPIAPVELPPADAKFFKTFMPYEMRLAQRRAMVWGSKNNPDLPRTFLGLYLVRLEPSVSGPFPHRELGGDELGSHVHELLRSALRDSDIPGFFKNQEHFAVARDVDPEHAYVIAQRFLSASSRSELLDAAGVKVRIGYVIYPLSSPPNYPVNQWDVLVDMARLLSFRDQSGGPTTGYGLLRGPAATDAGIPETDVIPLALQDPEPMVKAGVLKLQRIHVVPAT